MVCTKAGMPVKSSLEFYFLCTMQIPCNFNTKHPVLTIRSSRTRGRKLRNFKCRVHQLFYLMFTSDLSFIKFPNKSWACSHEASVINDVQMIKLILKPSLELKKWQLGGDIRQNPTPNNCVWYPLCAATACETLRISWFSARMSCPTQACCNWSTSCRPLFHVHSWKRCSGLYITCI